MQGATGGGSALGALGDRAGRLLRVLGAWPVLDTLRTLRHRFGEDRLGLSAGSLTFTTLIALVPLATVMLAVFTAFPMFSRFQGALESYFLQSLVPERIALPVLQALTQFSGKARGLGSAGLVVLAGTALALMLTIDRTLNAIWRVRTPRPLAQRVLVYWAGLTLGPLALGVSLSTTSLLLTSAAGGAGGMAFGMPAGMGALLRIVPFVLLSAAMAGLYHFVPNTQVQWRHAWAGGVFVAAAFEAAQRGLAWYLETMPTYSMVYGAFATLPILLLWIYLSWVIVLLGAVVAAYAPALRMRIVRRPVAPGQGFELALALVRELRDARSGGPRGLTTGSLAERLRVDPLQIEPVLEALVELDWVAPLDEAGESRHVLLCEPAETPAWPLLDRLLLHPGPESSAFRARTRWKALMLSEVLG